MNHPTYTITDQGFVESPGSVTGERQDPLGPADSVGSSSASHAGAAGIDVGKPDDSAKHEEFLVEELKRAERAMRDKRMKADQAIEEWKRAEQLVVVRFNRYLSFTRANELWKVL